MQVVVVFVNLKMSAVFMGLDLVSFRHVDEQLLVVLDLHQVSNKLSEPHCAYQVV